MFFRLVAVIAVMNFGILKSTNGWAQSAPEASPEATHDTSHDQEYQPSAEERGEQVVTALPPADRTIWVELKGIREFQDLADFRELLLKNIPENSTLMEKQLSRGRVLWKLQTSLDAGSLRGVVSQLSLKGRNQKSTTLRSLRVTQVDPSDGGGGEAIQVEISER